MVIKDIEFIGSFPRFKDIQHNDKPEICFWGRSNVGKSSLINMLCNRKEIAKISGKPGKTQSFNQYLIDGKWLIMDLPGYGYARVSKKLKDHWFYEMPRYLQGRQNLCLMLLLIDSSIPPQKIDFETMEQLGNFQVPFYVVATKSDKNTKLQAKRFIAEWTKLMGESWENLPLFIPASTTTLLGKEELLDEIYKVVDRFIN